MIVLRFKLSTDALKKTRDGIRTKGETTLREFFTLSVQRPTQRRGFRGHELGASAKKGASDSSE